MGKSIIDTSSVTRVGLDLAKRVFRIHAVDATGSVVIARSINRRTLLKFFDALPRCVVAMEACASAHHWGRQLLELGFAVRLIPPAHVKPYVRRNKNDAADAAAICEAAGRPGQRFVPVRSVENQAALMRHRARELMVGQRTAALNALRGHLSEIGVVAAQGVQKLELGFRPGRMHAADAQARGVQTHFQAIAEADEGISRQPLASLDAFQQKSRPKGFELQIRRYRRIEIGGNVKRRLHAFNLTKPHGQQKTHHRF